MLRLIPLLTAKGLAGVGAAILALGGAAVLATHGSGPPSSVVPPLAAPLSSAAADGTGTPGSSLDTITLSTPSASPSNHGAVVTQAVASRKAALPSGQHGIGPCVSKVASSNGQTHRSTHPTPPSHPTPPAHPSSH